MPRSVFITHCSLRCECNTLGYMSLARSSVGFAMFDQAVRYRVSHICITAASLSTGRLSNFPTIKIEVLNHKFLTIINYVHMRTSVTGCTVLHTDQRVGYEPFSICIKTHRVRVGYGAGIMPSVCRDRNCVKCLERC